MDNVTDFNAAKAREATDKARGEDLAFVRLLSECLAAAQAAASSGQNTVNIHLPPDLHWKVKDEILRRGFMLRRLLAFGAIRGLSTQCTHVMYW